MNTREELFLLPKVLTISEWIQTYESVFVICYDIEMDLLVYSRYLGWDCGGVSSWNWLTVTVPQQNNTYDCGVHTIHNAWRLAEVSVFVYGDQL